MKKCEFVESLQAKPQPLHPHQISQEIRLKIGFLSTNRIDAELDVELLRGYFVKGEDKPNRSPEDPELFECVVSGRQSQSWQMLVWTKEILHILDNTASRTSNSDALKRTIENRFVSWAPNQDTPLNVAADVNGFIFALACMVPFEYRKMLRARVKGLDPDFDQLENQLLVPPEYIHLILDESFEEKLRIALEHDRSS